MSDPTDYKKIFEEMLSNKDFGSLGVFESKDAWSCLDRSEKEALAYALLSQGETLVEKNDEQAIQVFKKIHRFFPKNVSLLYRQAKALTSVPYHALFFQESIGIFEKILKLKPRFFEARLGLAYVLVAIAQHENDSELSCTALKQFIETETFLENASHEEQTQFWRGYGLCMHVLGTFSGEPHDFKKSVDFFRKAKELGANDVTFWVDYGSASLELAKFTENTSLFVDTIEIFQDAIKLDPHRELSWHYLARTLTALFELDPKASYFDAAHACFEKLIEFNPEKAVYWFHWGELFLFKSKEEEGIESLLKSAQKFETADRFEPHHPHILGAWAETYMLLGVRKEEPYYLKSAQSKINHALEKEPSFPPLLRLKGDCLFELGNAYKDTQYLKEACIHYREALKIEPSNKFLWHGLAVSLSILGHQLQDSALLYESLQLFSRVIELGGEGIPQFWNDWGTALVKQGLLSDEVRYFHMAAVKFEKAIALAIKEGGERAATADWFYHLGCAYEFIGDIECNEIPYEKALEAFSKALEIEPSFHVVYFNLACALARMGDLTAELDFFSEAHSYFEKVVQLDFEDDQAWCEWGVSLLNMAELLADPGREETVRKCYVQAEKMFLQAIALGNLTAYYYIACVYSLTHHNEAAIHHLEKCREHRVLPRLEELLADEWLDNVRQTALFRHFLAQF